LLKAELIEVKGSFEPKYFYIKLIGLPLVDERLEGVSITLQLSAGQYSWLLDPGVILGLIVNKINS
jgi:hypothetical protein